MNELVVTLAVVTMLEAFVAIAMADVELYGGRSTSSNSVHTQ